MASRDPEPPRTALWVRVLLGLSLALNLLVIGLIAGALLRGGGPDRMRDAPVHFGAALLRALPDEDRRAVMRTLRSDAPDRGSRRDAARQIASALRAEPFDAQALQTALAAQADRLDQLQRATRAAWLARVAQMSPDARAAYADRVEARLTRARAHGGNGPRD